MDTVVHQQTTEHEARLWSIYRMKLERAYYQRQAWTLQHWLDELSDDDRKIVERFRSMTFG